MKIKLYILIVMLLSVLSFSSCLKDDTNLKYQDVILPDSVIITDISDANKIDKPRQKFVEYGSNYMGGFNVLTGEELLLEAEVFCKGDCDIGYEWIINDVVISKEKVLKYRPIDNVIMHLNITRGEGRAGANYKFQLIATHPFASGVFVMAKKDGKIIMDFYKYYTELVIEEGPIPSGAKDKLPKIELIEDIFELYNGYPSPITDPVGMFWIRDKVAKNCGIQLVDRDYQKSSTVMVSTMKENAKMRDEWIEKPSDFITKGFSSLVYSNIIIGENGNMYLRTNYDKGIPNTGRYSSSPLRYNDPIEGWRVVEADKHCSINLTYTTGYSLVYEKTKKQFLGMHMPIYSFEIDDNPDNIVIEKLPAISLSTNQVELRNFDKEVLYTFPEAGALLESNFDIIYKDGNTYRVQGHKLSHSAYGGITYTIIFNSELSSELTTLLKTPGVRIFKDKNSRRKGELCIAAGKKLYLSDMTGTVINEIAEFDSNVTYFKKMMPWTTSNTASTNYYVGKVCVVGFEDGTFEILKLYLDPNKPGINLIESLAKKKYDSGFIDTKITYSNTLLDY